MIYKKLTLYYKHLNLWIQVFNFFLNMYCRKFVVQDESIVSWCELKDEIVICFEREGNDKLRRWFKNEEWCAELA